MSSILSQTQKKLSNLEISMNFMQNEHAQTLRGLHDEIHKLQTKCSELTFELHMTGNAPNKGPCDHDSKFGDTESLKTRYKNKIAELRQENCLLKSGLEEKASKIKLLEFQLATAQADSLENIQRKELLIKSLQSDVESKGDQLAYLMSKLHNAKVIQMRVPTATASSSTSSTVAVERSRFSPTPPPHRRHSPRPLSRPRSIDFSTGTFLPQSSGVAKGEQSDFPDPVTSAAVEILSEQEHKTVVVNKSLPLPAIGDPAGTRSFLSKLKFNRNRENAKVPPYKAT